MKIQCKGKSAEILLYEDIGGWFGISSSEFVRQVKAEGDINEIRLRINSNGGSVFDGIAIYNYLKSHKARVTVDVDGLAASIASIIAMAGDEIRMADNAWMMIHDPWTMAVGNSGDFRKMADELDGVRESLLDTYMKKVSLSREDVSEMMTDETWLNASDAVEYGFASSVTEELKIAASVHKDWFNHVPKELISSVDPERRKISAAKIARIGHNARRYRKRSDRSSAS